MLVRGVVCGRLAMECVESSDLKHLLTHKGFSLAKMVDVPVDVRFEIGSHVRAFCVVGLPDDVLGRIEGLLAEGALLEGGATVMTWQGLWRRPRQSRH